MVVCYIKISFFSEIFEFLIFLVWPYGSVVKYTGERIIEFENGPRKDKKEYFKSKRRK